MSAFKKKLVMYIAAVVRSLQPFSKLHIDEAPAQHLSTCVFRTCNF